MNTENPPYEEAAAFLKLLAFILFRVFDIAKPQPVKWADSRVKGGLGVMLDDTVAAVCTIVLIQILHWLFA